MTPYPCFLDLRGRDCVVLGDGRLAAQKARELVDAGARVVVVGPRPCAELQGMAASGAVTVRRRRPRPEDLVGTRLAVDASGDAELNRAVFERGERNGVLVNVVDRPELCHFIAPAVVRRRPLLVAISTSGESPYLAMALRRRLERILDREWGPFVALVGRVRRRLRTDGVAPPQQARVYRRLLHSPVRDLLRDHREAEADAAAAAIAEAVRNGAPGRVALVGAGPGDPGLLTVAAREWLAEADDVLHDALVHPGVLACCGPDTRLVPVGRRAGGDGPEHAAVIATMIELARSGRDVVRLKGGDPFVFGRGWEELTALRAAGLEVTVVPGVSAATAAPAAAAIPVTRRGVASSVAITTGHDAVHWGAGRLEQLAAAADTLVVLMPLANLGPIARRLAGALGGDRPAALVASATWSEQRVVRAPIATVHRAAEEAGITAPATLIVGEVAREITGRTEA